jgi:hypothetical protein
LVFAPELAEESEGFDRSSFERLADLKPGSFCFRTRNRLPCWTLEHYFPDATNFLEIGCGTGFVVAADSRTFSTNAPIRQRNCSLAIEFFMEESFLVNVILPD